MTDRARAFAVAARLRRDLAIGDALFAPEGPLAFADEGDAGLVAAAMNDARDVRAYPERAVRTGDLMAAALIQEMVRVVLERSAGSSALASAADRLVADLGDADVEALLRGFSTWYPPTPVYRGEKLVSFT